MPKAAQSNSIRLAVVLLGLVLGACARQAPALPSASPAGTAPSLAPEERSAECTKLSSDIAALRSEMKTIEQVMAGSRHKDQVEGYLSAVLFPPAALAIDQQKSRKTALDERQQKIDIALARQHALGCSAN